MDLIETWGFREDIKDVKDINKIMDDNNNNNINKDNDSDIKIEKFIKMLTQYLSSWTW